MIDMSMIKNIPSPFGMKADFGKEPSAGSFRQMGNLSGSMQQGDSGIIGPQMQAGSQMAGSPIFGHQWFKPAMPEMQWLPNIQEMQLPPGQDLPMASATRGMPEGGFDRYMMNGGNMGNMMKSKGDMSFNKAQPMQQNSFWDMFRRIAPQMGSSIMMSGRR